MPSDTFGVVLATPANKNLLCEPGIPDGTFLCDSRTPCTKDRAIAAGTAFGRAR
jgi:hypothetical protein